MFLQQNNIQFIHNKCHDYGWADAYLITSNGQKAGYGAVWGMEKREDRDAIFEFFNSGFEQYTHIAFQAFHSCCKAMYIQCQTNESLLPLLLFEFSENIHAEAILFEDHCTTALAIPGTLFRKKEPGDDVPEDCEEYVLLHNKTIVADGGLMLNYNIPFADIYMKVSDVHRRKGFGSLIVQELKKIAYAMQRVPAARCNINNKASKGTLLKVRDEALRVIW